MENLEVKRLNRVITKIENNSLEYYNLVILTQTNLRIFDGKVTKKDLLSNLNNIRWYNNVGTIKLINVIIGEEDSIIQNGTNVIATNLYEYYILEN